MAARKRKTEWGGVREGSGRKFRVPGERASVARMLKFTPGEDAALQLLCPEDVPMARWLVDTLLAVLMVPCRKCGAPLTSPDGRPLYPRGHTCVED